MEPDFGEEYPGADARSAECFMNLVRAGDVLVAEVNRRLKADFDLSATAGIVLAIIDGAGGPITPSEVAERAIVTSASVTSLLDTLERRGFLVRVRHPTDRRKLLLELTAEGRAVVDRFLPGIYEMQTRLMAPLTPKERSQLLDLLAKVQASASLMAAQPAEPLGGVRNVPGRLRRARPHA